MSRFPADLPAGLIGDETDYGGNSRWRDCDGVRWVRGRAQTRGGAESLIIDLLGGVCRWILPFSGVGDTLHMAFGTHATLEVWISGEKHDITPVGLAPGQINGSPGSGYGAGGYGIGGYGEPTETEYFVRTWSGGAWGRDLIASPQGGTIYYWASDPNTPASALTNAPEKVTYCLVSPKDEVFAFGCNEEASGTFNPLCIRHSSERNNNEWATGNDTTAREYILPGGGKIVGARVLGDYLLCWTTEALFLGQFVGAIEQIWRFDRVGGNCGLIGPNAAAILGLTAYWLSGDDQYRRYTLGQAPEVVECPLRSDIVDHLALGQSDKVVASTCAQYNEVRFDYPDSRDGIENSRYHVLTAAGSDAGAWARGKQGRTAYVDAAPSDFPCATTFEGNIYWQERGNSTDGGALSGFLETNDLNLGLDRSGFVRKLWPDFLDQIGPVSVTVYARFKLQDQETAHGPYTLTPGRDELDLRVSGRFFRLRYDFNSSPAYWRIGLPVFDLQAMGLR